MNLTIKYLILLHFHKTENTVKYFSLFITHFKNVNEFTIFLDGTL